jgi:hypothetical protein
MCVDLDPEHPEKGPRSVDPHSPRSGCRIVCVSGLPSPEAIRWLGDEYQPRPEFLLGHLERERIFHERTSFELPALPSRRDNIIHIRFIRLCRSGIRSGESESSVDPDFETLSQDRQAAKEATHTYEKKLFDGGHFGATRVRKVNLHSTQYFSVEQLVSFSVVEDVPGQWTGKRHHAINAIRVQLTMCSGLPSRPRRLRSDPIRCTLAQLCLQRRSQDAPSLACSRLQ